METCLHIYFTNRFNNINVGIDKYERNRSRMKYLLNNGKEVVKEYARDLLIDKITGNLENIMIIFFNGATYEKIVWDLTKIKFLELKALKRLQRKQKHNVKKVLSMFFPFDILFNIIGFC